MKLILGLILIFVIGIIYILINNYLKEQQEYESSIPAKSDAVGITFNQFYSWYQLNPKRWVLLNDSVRIITKPSKTWYDEDIFKVCYFNSSKEWRKYKEFKEDLKIAEANEKINKATIEILEAVQQDIDALRKQSNQEIKEASDKIFEISERLNK